MSETRREVLTKLLMGPLATLGVQNAVEIPADTKVLILNFSPEDRLDHYYTHQAILEVLTKAGMAQTQVLITQGLDGVAIIN